MANKCGCFVFWACVLTLSTVCSSEDDFEGSSTITLEHSFDAGAEPVFSKRGTVTIRSLKLGEAYISQEAGLDQHQLQQLKHLVDQDGFYRVRVPVANKSSSAPVYVSAALKACLFYESYLSDILTFNMDPSGSILGISIATKVPYCEGLQPDHDDLGHINTRTDVIATGMGPAPETQVHVQKMEQEKAEKAKGTEADNRSFLAKYWMYIVPLVIFMMFASNADPSQGGGGR